ncbi:MAG: hypothetical protein WCT10_04010 [Patescibacteria group bacterium]
MFTTDQQSLVDFVLRHCADKKLAQRALAVIDPYFTEAKVGIFPLDIAWHVDQDAAKAALAVALGKTITDLRVLAGSLGTGLSANGALPADLAAADAEAADVDPSADFVFTSVLLLSEFRDELAIQLDDEQSNELMYKVYDTLGLAVQINMKTAYAQFFGRLNDNAANTIALMPMACVFYLLGFAMAGDVGMFERLKLLVELCRHAIPIGEIKARPAQDGQPAAPGKWLLLAG